MPVQPARWPARQAPLPVTTTCARPSPKISRRMAPKPRRLQLEADDEQQEDDAELGDVQDFLAVGDQPRRRADGDAGGEIAENGAEADALEQRRRDHGAAEQQQHFGIDAGAVDCHDNLPSKLRRVPASALQFAVMPHPLHKHGRNNRWCRSDAFAKRGRNVARPGTTDMTEQRRCLQACRPRRRPRRGREEGRRRRRRRGGGARPLEQRVGAARQGRRHRSVRKRRHFAARLRRQAGRQRLGDRLFDPAELAERAVAMARVSPEDPYPGPRRSVAAGEDSPRSRPVRRDRRFGRTAEGGRACGRRGGACASQGVTNSGGSGASAGLGGLVLATSHGFLGQYVGSRFSRSASVIAGEGTGDGARLRFFLAPAFRRSRRARRQSAARPASARSAPQCPQGARQDRSTVVFDPRVARGIAGHLAGAINGASVARKTSFLRDMMGKQVASRGHHRHRRSAARARPSRRGRSTAKASRASRSTWSRTACCSTGSCRPRRRANSAWRPMAAACACGTSVSPSSTNLAIEPGDTAPGRADRRVKTGFYVTEVFGQGVNMVTGEYSRGASGFWIENGELAYPVSEVTIASNLKDMFLNIDAGQRPRPQFRHCRADASDRRA